MTQWEYTVVDLADDDGAEAMLTEYGLAGWELVQRWAVERHRDWTAHYLFKRPRGEPR